MDFKFAENEQEQNNLSSNKWKLLIADDEEGIHSVTKLALKKLVFENKSIEFFDAYNGEETVKILKNNPDIDLVLLDVVMESDSDGLQTVRKIREELNNKNVRIILRTGQPGYAPEQEVILNYDIDDYKEKTELTSRKLFTTVITAFRTSKHLKNNARNREGLVQIIEASKSIFKLSSLLTFTDGVLKQLGTILNLSKASVYERSSNSEGDCFFATLKNNDFHTLSTSGKFRHSDDSHVITAESLVYLNRAYLEKNSFFVDDVYVGYFHSEELNRIIFLYLEGCSNLDNDDKKFLEVFANNISIAFENICLIEKNKQKDSLLAQQSRMATMGEMIDNIAHQWRQPLSLITTSVSGMKIMKENDTLKEEEFFKYCDSIIDTSLFLSNTIEDFRSFFKLNKVKSDFTLKEVIDKALFLLSSRLGLANIKMEVNISDIKIKGLKNEFIQVILNVINNAFDALCETDEEKKLIIIDGILSDEEKFCLTIKDNAGGIPDDIINDIFEQYFTTKESSGTGIGLYMSKYIVEEQMHGKFTVNNEKFNFEDKEYKGACFVIEASKNQV